MKPRFEFVGSEDLLDSTLLRFTLSIDLDTSTRNMTSNQRSDENEAIPLVRSHPHE